MPAQSRLLTVQRGTGTEANLLRSARFSGLPSLDGGPNSKAKGTATRLLTPDSDSTCSYLRPFRPNFGRSMSQS
jgi:hypothetical protein